MSKEEIKTLIHNYRKALTIIRITHESRNGSNEHEDMWINLQLRQCLRDGEILKTLEAK